MWALLPLLLAQEVRSFPECPGYSCAEPGYYLGEYEKQPICMNMTSSGNYWMSLCENFGNGMGCVINNEPLQPSICGEIPVPLPDPSYPGEPCSVEQDCIGNNTVHCIEGLCTGLDVGKDCAQDYDCGVGSFCDLSPEANGLCAFQLSEGEACIRDDQCLNFLGCTGITTATGSVEGTCEPYFSIPAGSAVLNCIEEDGEWFNKLCESGVCWPNKPGFDGPGVCVAAFTSTSSLPVACTSDTQCTGISGKLTATKTCTCGKNPTGTSYCPVFSGDQPSLNLQQQYMDLLQFNMSECHTSRRFSDFCFETYLTSQDFADYMTNVMLVADYPSYVDNDNCVQVNLLNDFYGISQADLQCPAFACGQLESGQCAIFNEGVNEYQLQQCTGSTACDVEDLTNANVTCSTPQPMVSYLYPGDSCSGPSQCVVNSTCVNGVCKGLQQNQDCSYNPSACDVGLACGATLTCVPLATVGSNCFADSDCVLNAGCNLSPQTLTGTCVQYFSLANNSAVFCPATGLQPLCASGWCKQSLGLHTGMCVPAPTTVGSTPRGCKVDSDCTDSTGMYTTKCVCGYNPTGTQYCELFPGDAPYASYLSTVRQVLQDSNSISSVCQTTRRFQGDCLANMQKGMNLETDSKDSDPYLLTRNFYYATLYPLIVGNDDCVKNIFTSQYWSIPGYSHNKTSAATELVATVGLMLLTVG